MTLREQLTEQVAAIRAGWALTPPPAMPRAEEVTLECRPAMPPPPTAAIRGALGRINAFAIGGAGAGYLVVRGVKTEPVGAVAGPAFRVTVRIAIREQPWAGFHADFAALLDALEPGATTPDMPETWHDRKGML